MVCIAKSFTLALLLTGAVLKSVGQGGGQISLQAECLKKVGPKRSGVAASTFYIGSDIGQGIGPVIGGTVAASFGCETTFMLTAVILVIGLVVFNIYQKKQKCSNTKLDAGAI